MTDPLEDRLRAHLAERADRVTAEPDADAFVERSAGRSRPRAPFIAGLAAAAVLVVGGSFAGGLSVAGSTAVPAPRPGGAAAAVAGGSSVPAEVPTTTTPASSPTPLTSLFIRTTSSGVTIRTYASGASTGICTGSGTCPGSGGAVPLPSPCPTDAACAQPVIEPASHGTAIDPGSVGPSGGTLPGSTSGSGVPSTTTTSSTGPVVTLPAAMTSCRMLTLEFSSAQAVGTAMLSAPTTGALTAGAVQLLGSGTFGAAEGAPVDWVAVAVGSDAAQVHLVSAAGVVLDAMAPDSGVAVLAAVGSTVGAGASVVGLDTDGSQVATVPVDPSPGQSGAPGCESVPPPVDPSTTTTSPTVVTPSTTSTTTGTATTTTTTTGVTTTTDVSPIVSPPASTSRSAP